MPWSHLPDDLLQDIYVKVVGLLHRVRFAAVCRSWRAAAVASRVAAPPALPLLICSTPSHREDSMTIQMYCPEDDRVLRIPLPSELVGKKFVGAHDGGWVAALGHDLQLAIVNIFSRVEVRFPKREIRDDVYTRQCWHTYIPPTDIVHKVVFSESPTSSDCILGVITQQCDTLVIGCPRSGWTTKKFDGLSIMDILFFKGQLHVLANDYGELIKLEIGVNKEDGHMVIGVPSRLSIQYCSGLVGLPYDIVELDGKLMVVVRYWPSDGISHEPFFMMYEIPDELTTEKANKCEEVTRLGDYTLFLGRMWSKAVYVPVTGRGEVQKSCIYTDDATYLTSLDGHDDLVYPKKDESRGDAMHGTNTAGSCGYTDAPRGMWIFPRPSLMLGLVLEVNIGHI